METPTAAALETASTGTMKAPTAATLETAAAALEAATAGKLLAARRTALGKSSGLSPIAGIKGRALGGKVATPGATAKLRRTKVGAMSQTLGPARLSTRTRLQTVAAAAVRPAATLSSGTRCHTGLSGPACPSPELTSSPGPGTAAAPLKAAVVPAGCRTGGFPPKALTGRRIAIGNSLAMRRIVLPSIAADGSAIDAVELIGVDVDAAASPIWAPPAPERADHGDTGAKG
jgi:hypothetical protein